MFVAQCTGGKPDFSAWFVLDDHVVYQRLRVCVERVPGIMAGERGKVVVVRDTHDNPLDDIGVSQDTDVHERGAPRVDAHE